MRYKLLGNSGLRVSELALGTMTFGENWGWGASKEESRRMFEAYVQAGGNFIDTANRYTDGNSERYVGEFIAQDRERFVLATKYSLAMREHDPNAGGNHRKNMVQAVEASLKRLGTEYIDLFWLHAWDYMTPVAEVMRGLDDLVRAGKVLYVGISDTPAWIVSQANTLAELRGWSRFVALQVPYSLAQRDIERDLLPMARAFDMAVTTWGVLGSGVLTGKFRGERSQPTRVDPAKIDPRKLAIADEIVRVAAELGTTPARVAVSWVLKQPGVIIPILGARTAQQLTDNLASLEVTLTSEQLAKLSEVSKIELGFPHDFLAGNREWAFMASKIDNHRGA
jgi:aryl-alcohol dehydrogenase-like predicted oxidoreductase